MSLRPSCPGRCGPGGPPCAALTAAGQVSWRWPCLLAAGVALAAGAVGPAGPPPPPPSPGRGGAPPTGSGAETSAVTAGWLDELDEVLYDIDEALLASAELRLEAAMAALKERSAEAESSGDGDAAGNRLVRT